MSEQKIELLEFLNTKNSEISWLKKQLQESYDDIDEKFAKQEPNTMESSSLSRNQSDSLLTLLKILDVPIVGSMYTEENLKALLQKYETFLSKNRKVEQDNANLRTKLDEVS